MPAGTITLSNCTVSGNSAVGVGSGASGIGGGLSRYGGAATLTDCTVSGNSATTSGGGLFSTNSSTHRNASMTLTNCTVSGNSAGYGRRPGHQRHLQHGDADQLHRQRQLRQCSGAIR